MHTHMNNWISHAFPGGFWSICSFRPGRGIANYFKALYYYFTVKSPHPPPFVSISISLHYLRCAALLSMPRLVSPAVLAHCSIDHAAWALLTDFGPGFGANKVRNNNGGERSRGVWGGPFWPQLAISIPSYKIIQFIALRGIHVRDHTTLSLSLHALCFSSSTYYQLLPVMLLKGNTSDFFSFLNTSLVYLCTVHRRCLKKICSRSGSFHFSEWWYFCSFSKSRYLLKRNAYGSL